jgi:hypothetical protein
LQRSRTSSCRSIRWQRRERGQISNWRLSRALRAHYSTRLMTVAMASETRLYLWTIKMCRALTPHKSRFQAEVVALVINQVKIR